jgi:hypothetical protein
MEKNIKYIIREVPPEQSNFSFYFDNDCFTGAGGDWNYNLFIVAQSYHDKGFNEEEYNEIVSEIESMLDEEEVEPKYAAFIKECNGKPSAPYRYSYNNFEAYKEEMVARYLTIKTGTEWNVVGAYGYSQGDYVKVVYCKEHYSKESAQAAGEIWLGSAKEFGVHEIDDDGEEIDSCYGYIVADCQVNYATQDADYKRIVSEWSDITQEDDVALEMVEGSHTVTHYTYRTV